MSADILALLRSVIKSGEGWTAKCPAHDDTRNSLSVCHHGGKWLLKCHAGCEIRAITAALGIQVSDLFDDKCSSNSKKNGKAKFIAEYIYRTAHGELSRKVCRTTDKGFPQFRWTGSKWQSGTEGVPVLPYRLPELVAADPEVPIFICEGEKDCDRLAALGFIATTNPMGAGKWRACLNKWFANRPVFIIPDNDEPGRKHAADVARHLKPVAARIHIVELPGITNKGGDVSDWLELDPNNKDRLLDVATVRQTEQQDCDGAAQLTEIHSFLGRFVAYPSDHAHVAHVLWIAHAHLMDAWESTPRIAFLSPEPASGKTRSMEVSELLVPNPVAAVNVTPAYLFRKVGGEDGPPTILFDEIDTVFGPKAKENEELRALLNAGHRRGAVAGRCVVRGKLVETEEIPAYAAVALAGLGWLPDTILSRSIIIRMRRRAPDEKVETFRRRINAPQGEGLCRRLAGWAATILDEATEARPAMPHGVEDRNADMWEPLLAVADIAGGSWPDRARKAAVALVAVARDVEPSLNIRLLADLRTVFGDDEALATKTILAALYLIVDAPWSDLKGKPLNDNQLARRLRQYGVKSKNVRIGDAVPKGYARADLHDVWRRYLPPLADKPATAATAATSQSFQDVGVAAAETRAATEPLHGGPDVAAVAGDVAACSGLAEPSNADEIDIVAPVAAVAPSPRNGGDAGLGPRIIREMADWYMRDDGAGVIQHERDAELRRALRERVLPEFIDLEFERVMQAVFGA